MGSEPEDDKNDVETAPAPGSPLAQAAGGAKGSAGRDKKESQCCTIF